MPNAFYRGVFILMVAYAAAEWADLCIAKDKKILIRSHDAVQREVLIAQAHTAQRHESHIAW